MGSVEKARQVVTLTNAHEMVQDLAKQSCRQISRDIVAGQSSEHADQIVKTIEGVFTKHIPSMIDIVIGGMVGTYSDQELDALIEFYSSDLGKIIIAKQRDLQTQSMGELGAYNTHVIYPALQEAINLTLDQIELELKAKAQEN